MQDSAYALRVRVRTHAVQRRARRGRRAGRPCRAPLAREARAVHVRAARRFVARRANRTVAVPLIPPLTQRPESARILMAVEKLAKSLKDAYSPCIHLTNVCLQTQNFFEFIDGQQIQLPQEGQEELQRSL